MRILVSVLVFLQFFSISLFAQKQNHLANETSPYLLQHVNNPVDWYPWNDSALTKAKTENKLLVISIGYAACHWCHVMEEESYEDETVAKLMNENFVSIKVDREERPDIDQIYMNACFLLTGNGGWPLNIIALPNGKPIYAGTYYPKNQWLQVLQYFVDMKKSAPEKLNAQAEQITQNIAELEIVTSMSKVELFTNSMIEEAFDKHLINLDYKNGGSKSVPKFPMPANFMALLKYHQLSGNKKALKNTLLLLEKIHQGGIYDHIGGGFARYSTDEKWFVPHFEKMLYDNAQLVSLYSKAFKITKNEDYKTVIEETIQFLETEMMDENGGFYSSIDADSEGEEGKFYTWNYYEFREVCGEDADLFSDYYNIIPKGNWENSRNICFTSSSLSGFSKFHKISDPTFKEKLKTAKKALYLHRKKRKAPAKDKKIITAWNSLIISAYCDAYRAFGEEKFLGQAKKTASFMEKNLMKEDYSLFRTYNKNTAKINAFSDDYALFIKALLDLYQVSFDKKYLDLAKNLTQYTLKHFYDKKSGMFFYTSDLDSVILHRKMQLGDNVIPASNSVLAQDFFVLGSILDKIEYKSIAIQMLSNMKENIQNYSSFYLNWANLAMFLVKKPYELAIVGENSDEIRKQMQKNYLPFAIFVGGKTENNLALLQNRLIKNQTTIYVCQENICKEPTTNYKTALNLMQ